MAHSKPLRRVASAVLAAAVALPAAPALANTAERLAQIGIKYGGKPVTDDVLGKMSYVDISNEVGPLLTDGDCVLLGGLPQLKSLNIYRAQISKACIDGFAGAALLEQLNISNSEFTDGAIAAIGKLTGLKRLAFRQTLHLPVAEFRELAKLTRLESLTLSHGLSPRYGDAITDDHINAVAHPPNLTKLDLNGTDITDVGLRAVSYMKSLTELSLYGTMVTDRGLRQIASNAVKLAKLNAGQVRTLGPGAGAALARSSSLVEIDLSDSRVGGGLAPLGKIKSLRKLNIVNTGATEADLAGIAEAKGLLELRASGSRLIGDGAVASIAQLTELRQLFLNGSRITDTGVAGLAPLQKLSSLGCEECKLTDASAEPLAGMRLNTVILNRTGFTDAGLDRLLASKTLQYINVYYTKVSKEASARHKAARKGLNIYH